MNPKVIVIDGKTYHNVDEMPADIREKYERAMRSLGGANSNDNPETFENLSYFRDKDKDSAPDMLENIAAAPVPVDSIGIIVNAKEFHTPDTSNGWMLLLTGLFILVFCTASAAAVWYLFFR